MNDGEPQGRADRAVSIRPPTVVVVGGAGVFGRHLVRGIAQTTGLHVVVAGRSLGRAAAAARELGGPGTRAARLDTATVTADELRALDAFAVVDAAGPFRPGQHGMARAAIDAGAHYIDLADGRAFVAGFGALDSAARAAGTVALTGASSTPALSCAVLDHLTAGWTRIDTVEVAILPGNRAPRGLAVMQSILSWAGRPVRVLLDGGWTSRRGWGLTRRLHVPGLGRRWASLADTPDLDIVPARYAVARTALFRAGLELTVLHAGLAVLARIVGPRGNLAAWAAPLRVVAGWLALFGTDRGGMHVAVTGLDPHGVPLQRRWTLVAEAGDGPVIPTLAALACLRRLTAGPVPPGARACTGLLTLDDFTAEFARYRITTRRHEGRPGLRRPLLARALGEAAYAALPGPLRAAHAPDPWLALEGRSSVEGARGLFARVAAAMFGFPHTAADVPVRVTMEAVGADEVWVRDFAGRRFRSRLRPGGAGVLTEQFGPFRFRLNVPSDSDGLSIDVIGWDILGLRLPLRWAPRATAREWADGDGRFHFDVAIALPWAGRLVRYRGWLRLASPGSLHSSGSLHS